MINCRYERRPDPQDTLMDAAAIARGEIGPKGALKLSLGNTKTIVWASS
jgi:hypothetical protein